MRKASREGPVRCRRDGARASSGGRIQRVTCRRGIRVAEILAEDGEGDVPWSVVQEGVGDLSREGIGEHAETTANRGLGVRPPWQIGKTDTGLISNLLQTTEGGMLTGEDHVLVRRVGRVADASEVTDQP